jgi:hypothetical protein
MSLPHPSFSPSLAGQVAFVTGASSGLGHRFAETLASVGAEDSEYLLEDLPDAFRYQESGRHFGKICLAF